LLDADLYLPESWDDDRDRCRQAAIPDEVRYRPKWRIAFDQLLRLDANGVRFDWLTFDEGYGSKPELFRELTARNQRYVAEVPRSFTTLPFSITPSMRPSMVLRSPGARYTRYSPLM